jgi:hypothetical protein
MVLAAFLVQLDSPLLPLRVVIPQPHCHGRAHPGKGVGQHADQSPAAQTHHARGVSAIEQLARFLPAEYGGLAPFGHILGGPHRMRRGAKGLLSNGSG